MIILGFRGEHKIIAVIGAGPIGCYLGYLLAKQNKEVSIYEEHPVIGKPMQCTGIVTQEFAKIIKPKKEFIINQLKKQRLFSKHQTAELPSKDIVLDRTKLDKYLARKALKAGAKIHLNAKFLGMTKDFIVLAGKQNKIIKIRPKLIIGSDGPFSEVAHANNIFNNRQFYTGLQARVKGNFQKGTYETYFGSICPGFFAWLVPESEKTARIGLASRKNTAMLFQRFLKAKNIKNRQIIDRQAGLIPIFNKNIKIRDKNVFLVGDAAAQLKATTGGGLVPGLKAAEILADCIINKKNYEKEIRKLNRQLQAHLIIRRALDKFKDNDWDSLIKSIKDGKIRKILHITDRDNPITLLFKLAIAKPRLLSFLRKAF